MEIRYALLDSRRYPAMYLPYQLFLSSHRRRRRALPCISFASLVRLCRQNYEIDPESTRCPGGMLRTGNDRLFHFR